VRKETPLLCSPIEHSFVSAGGLSFHGIDGVEQIFRDSGKMDKVRVLFLPGVDAGNTNAQSLNVREIALRLDPGKFQSTLWYEDEPDPRLRSLPGIRLIRLPTRIKTMRILKEMLGGYDIIAYIDFSPATYIFLHLPRRIRQRTKAVFHAEAPEAQITNTSRASRFLYAGIFPRCDFYIGITEYVAQDVYRALEKRVSHVLGVGVDTSLFTPPSERTNPAPVVLFAGTLIERKGPQFVLAAAAQFPNATFRLVGASRQGFEEVLRQRIEQSALKNVTLEGPKTQPQMLEIMRESDIFLLPSRLEGIPKVTLEAAATGLPCIVFRDYETPSVIDGVTGFQVATLEDMMQALGKLVADRSLRERMGTAARKHMEKFDWNVVSSRWQRAYLEIAATQTT
jgi:glycosyltransferase involved in cell wall biosynthesis